MKDFKPKKTKVKNGSWTVFLRLCKGCGICLEKCPQKAIYFSKSRVGVYSTPSVEVDPEKCNVCGICERVCPDSALKLDKSG